ncbi:ABC1 kinase family protein [Aquabacterium sp. OR-4]|uniref:ABC1 kinase family protein n=1 Tax=Aquabacterium sp. OR-4 TaxID=2978127 RepID=UPI0021B25065|nr:AarF/UbiB family protein [Aquabacterium sp. OR-4]MDT7835684.1 AarF/UbiB family protein [Aquabacterium sp. OR-4]
MPLLQTLVSARDLGRLQHIAAVFMRHGLGDAVRRLGWADALEKAGHVLHRPHAAELARLTPPEQLRSALEELGPTFVKLGQVLAGRADLFGPDWIAQFEKLHSRAPAADLAALRAQITEDLGAPPEQVFAQWSDTPLAAASIAQVHAATLADGSEVVVKVRRPGIAADVEADLRLLARLAAAAERQWPELKPYRPVALAQQLGRSLRRELDLASECRNAERIAQAFAAQPEIVIPRVHWDFTHERINVQQRIRGVPAEDPAAMAAAGIDRRELARRGARAVLKMVIEDGFFHADPHAGNLFFLPGSRIAFIDFGMVGRVTLERREQLLSLMLGLVQRDAEAVADVLLAWAHDHGDGEDALDEDGLRGDIDAFVDQYHGVPLAQLSIGRMLGDVTGILRGHRLALPADLALLIKTFITLEGLGRGLDPGFHMAEEATPMLRQALHARYRPEALARRGWDVLRRSVGVLGSLPRDLSRLLATARRGRIQVHIDVQDLRQVADQLDGAAQRIAVGLVVAALIVGSAIVMTVRGGPELLGLPAFGLLGFAGAVAGSLWLLLGGRRRGNGNGA